MNHDEAFPPDTIDEQVDQFASVSSHESASPEIKVIQRLAAFYEADQHSTERVWKRLEPHLAADDAAAQPVSRSMATLHGSHKKRRPSLQPILRSAQWTGSFRFAQVAAVVFAVLLVGSLLLVFHMAQASRTATRPNQTTQTAGRPASPPGIYISRSDGVYRLNIQTRKVIWHAHVAGQSLFGDPVVIGDTVYIIMDGPVSALDAQTGALRWSHNFHGRVTDLYVDDGLLYFNTLFPLNTLFPSSDTIYAVNPANGTITATYTPKQAEWTRPVVVDDVLYYTAVSAGSRNSTLYAVQLPGEKLLWQLQLSNHVLFIAPKGIIVQNGIVYVQVTQESPSNNGLIDAFDAHTGSKLWQSPAIAGGLRIVTVTNEMIYAASFGGELLAFNIHTHALVWQKSFNTYDIRAASGMLYIEYGRGSGQLAALNATTGKLLWQQSKSNGLGLLGIFNGVVYGESWPNDGKDGTIYAFSASNGSQLWAMSTGVPNVQWGGMVAA